MYSNNLKIFYLGAVSWKPGLVCHTENGINSSNMVQMGHTIEVKTIVTADDLTNEK